jgi:hypothetical protein
VDGQHLGAAQGDGVLPDGKAGDRAGPKLPVQSVAWRHALDRRRGRGGSATPWIASDDWPTSPRTPAVPAKTSVVASGTARCTARRGPPVFTRSIVTISPSGRKTHSRRASGTSLSLPLKSKARVTSPRAATTPERVARAQGSSARLHGVWLGL